MTQLKYLAQFKQQLREQNVRGLALDVDETLSWTVGYWAEIMQHKFGNPENLTPREFVDKYRYAQNAPYWQTEEIQAWMEEHRELDSVQDDLPLIEDAHHTVNRINTIIPIVAYITARPETVAAGTKRWLDKHGFPKAALITRPKGIPHTQCNAWKAAVLREVYPEVIGIVDDNPGLIEALREAGGYKGTIFLYDSSEAPESNFEIVPVKTWDKVYAAVEKKFV